MVEVRHILRSLHLRNFGIHRDFVLDGMSSINLIVGANGVGKTTIADALSLVLGGKSDRFHHLKDLKEYIAEGSEVATVEIKLRNLKDSDGKYLLFSTDDEELNITLTLRENGPVWSVNGRGRMSRSQLHKFLQTGDIKIDMDDDIYYTKKNTVDLFMSGSAHEMFNQLFDPLSLASVREKIEILQDKTKNLKRKLPELQFKKVNIQRELKVAKEKKIEYERKLVLQRELEELRKLQVWIEVIELERQQQDVEQQFLDVADTLDQLQRTYQEMQHDFNELGKDKRRLEILIEDNDRAQLQIRRMMDKVTAQLIEFKQEISSLDGQLKTLRRRSQEVELMLVQQKKEYDQMLKQELILDQKMFEESVAMLNDERASVDRELGELMRTKEHMSRELKLLEGQIKKRVRDIELITKELEKESGYSIEEGENIWANEREALKLRMVVEGQPWGKFVTNPLFKEIFLTERGRMIKKAVNFAIGEYKSFLLAEGDDVLNNLRLVMENGKFRLAAAPAPQKEVNRPHVSRADVQKLPHNLREAISSTLEEVIEIENPNIRSFIFNKVRAVFAKEDVHYSVLVEIARRLKCDVITPRPSVFKSDGVFKTNMRHSLSLGSKTVNLSRLTNLEDKKQQLKDELPPLNLRKQEMLEEINLLSTQQVDLTNKWSRINSEIQRVLQMNPKTLLITIRTTEADLSDIMKQIEETERRKSEIETELQSLTKDELVKELEELERKKVELGETMTQLNRELILIDSRIEQMEQEISNVQSNYHNLEEVLVDLEQKITKALTYLPKERPEHIPSASEIRGGILEIQTRIQYIKATQADVMEFHRLSAMLSEIEESQEDLEKTLQETLDLLEEHKSHWINAVKETAQSLQDMANYLLSPRMVVKITVKNSLDFKRIGLEILFTDGVKSMKRFQSSSGGERSMITLALFLSLHTLRLTSPIHIIDEFSQRLDEENRGHALIMVNRVLEKIEEFQLTRYGEVLVKPQIFLIAPTVTGSHIPSEVDLTYLLKIKKIAT